MIFKRFSLHRKKSELRNVCKQEMLKSNFFSKNKNFRNASLEYFNCIFLLPMSNKRKIK